MTSRQIIRKYQELAEIRSKKFMASVSAYEEYKKNKTEENKVRLNQAQDESDLSYEELRLFLDNEWN